MISRPIFRGPAALVVLACSAFAAQPPYRFRLVLSDQWKDPASHVIEGGGDEFPVLVTLLKTWRPFEVLRLDQPRLDRYHLLDREGRPRYGTIIWAAGPRVAQCCYAGLSAGPSLQNRGSVSSCQSPSPAGGAIESRASFILLQRGPGL